MTSTNIILEGRNLQKTYRLGNVEVPVLKGASINIKDGEWVAVLGSSGSGKSTLLHLLGDLDRPDENKGSVHYRGEDLKSFSHGRRNAYRNRDVGFVFQFYHLLPELTVLENATLPGFVAWQGSRHVTEDGMERLESFGLGHRLNHRPRELSGGERQRVAIARALINRPSVLLADEPTGNLDEQTGEQILDLLAIEHQRGLAIVMVTHDHSIADRADRVVELHHGALADN